MQIGANIYCDSQCILREIERRHPEPTFFPGGAQGMAVAVSRWSDGELFDLCVKLILGAAGDALDPDFAADRGRLYLPLELLQSRNIFTTDPNEVIQHPEYPGAWRTLASEAAGWYHKAEIAMEACDPKAMKAARIMLEVYKANLERMRMMSDREIADPNVSKRLVGKGEKLVIALKYGFLR